MKTIFNMYTNYNNNMSKKQGLTVKKSNFSEWFTQIIDKADLADIRYGIQGFIVHKSWSIRIIKQIINMFEESLEKEGHEPVLFPLLIPEENLKKEAEHFGFLPEVFWVSQKGANETLNKRLALRPTSESAFYPMYSLWIRSYRDLPLKKYQSVTAYRNESVTRPFIRGHEFIWIESHDVFETHEESLKQIKNDINIMKNIMIEKLGIPILSFNRPEWDKFLGAESTFAIDVLMPDKKVLQVGATHDLTQKFSKTFDIKYLDKNGNENYVWQTCFGPGIWRIFAALISIHGDDKGLKLPFDIAPIQVVIIPIISKDNNSKIIKKCELLKNTIGKKFRVYIDDTKKTPGEKYNKWELYGVPFRIEIGIKELKSNFVTLSKRYNKTKIKIKYNSLENKIEKLSLEMNKILLNDANKFLKNNLRNAKNKNDFFKYVENGGIIKATFCGKENCAREIQNYTKGLKIRGTFYGKNEKVLGKCIYCNKSAKKNVYMAKQY